VARPAQDLSGSQSLHDLRSYDTRVRLSVLLPSLTLTVFWATLAIIP
jgi:hypothetical protein